MVAARARETMRVSKTGDIGDEMAEGVDVGISGGSPSKHEDLGLQQLPFLSLKSKQFCLMCP
jgi:hypothetical protein